MTDRTGFGRPRTGDAPPPSIAVVIPTCDRPAFLLEAVASVVAQTYAPHEFIIVDNGTTRVDRSMLPDLPGLRLLTIAERSGASLARNAGAERASADYVAFLDDDDTWATDYLEQVARTIGSTHADVVLGRLRDTRSGGPIRTRGIDFRSNVELINLLLVMNPDATGSSTTVRRTAFASIGGYDRDLVSAQDKALVLDLVLAGFSAARAAGAWVNYRREGSFDRITQKNSQLAGLRAFTRKYWAVASLPMKAMMLAKYVRVWLGWAARSAGAVGEHTTVATQDRAST